MHYNRGASLVSFDMPERDLLKELDVVIADFRGDVTELEHAVGALIVGRHLGWKPLLLVHDKKTLRKYEAILDVNFRDELPEVGALGERLRAYKIAKKVGNFWKAVRGMVPEARGPHIEG